MIYKFHLIRRYLHDEFQTIEQHDKDLFHELERVVHNENSYISQIIYLENEMKINNQKKLLKYLEQLKILLNKFETINDKNLQYHFLYSKLDRLYEILFNNYQIHLPTKTNIDSIRTTLNNIRKKTKKQIEELEQTKNDLLRKLDVLKTKEELKQRTKISSITEVIIPLFLYIPFLRHAPNPNVRVRS